MIEPYKFELNSKVTERDLLRNGFKKNISCYSMKKNLYGNCIIANFYIIEGNQLMVNVTDNNNYIYAPFYNPEVKYNNNVYIEVVKNFNNFVDKYVDKKIFVKVDSEEDMDTKEIRIKYFVDGIDKIEKIDKGDWIDLRAAEDVEMKAGEFKLISLGVGMILPEGYEAHILPRSSTYKNWRIIQGNSCGVIDHNFSGENDVWKFPAIAIEDTKIKKNDRICQFRIVERQPKINFIEVGKLNVKSRGGFGSTGKN